MTPRRGATILTGGVLLAGAWHIIADRTPPAWDDAWYLEVSFRLYYALSRGLADFASAWADAFKTKPPLVSLLPLPLYALGGPSERMAPFASLALHGLSCLLTGLAARALWREHPRREALAALAACLVGLTPLLYGLSRAFLVESLLTALVCAAAWRVAEGAREPREGLRLGALLGLGLLAKASFPLFVAGFAWSRRRDLALHARPALAVGAALAATWYAFNLPYAAKFALDAAFGGLAADYGRASPLDFPVRLSAQALSWPLAAAALVAAVRRPDAGSRFALAWAAPLLVFAFSANLEPRLWAPALPAFALLAARAVLGFESRALRAAATSALLAACGFVFVRQTFTLPPGRAMPWNGAPSADPGWDRAALVDAVAAASGPSGVAAVALEDRRLNANNLSSLAAARGLGLRFISLGYAQSSVEGALIRLKDKDASVLVLVDGVATEESPSFLNMTNDGVAKAVASGRLPARLVGRVALSPGASARVYRVE
jgi:4-amino-4-deoxy-L-arabinose transferase-like glycosyltransferase